MKFVICCLGLLCATPAIANSMEDALCQAPSQPVASMANPEKLCRSFVRSLGKLPSESAREVMAVLTPESIALMGTLTAAWIGFQGIPVVGQAVDAAVLALGVVALVSQAAMIAEALWTYVNRATTARDDAELDAAASYLARAMAVAGVSIVTFILMKKVVGNSGVRPPGLEPVPAPASAARAPRPASSALGVAAVSGEAVPVVAMGVRSSAGLKPQESSLFQKSVDPKAFREWLNRASRRPAREAPEPFEYQQRHAGPEEYLMPGGGEQVWADGARLDRARLVEVKYINTPEKVLSSLARSATSVSAWPSSRMSPTSSAGTRLS